MGTAPALAAGAGSGQLQDGPAGPGGDSGAGLRLPQRAPVGVLPVHLLWEHSLARKEWLRTTGVVNGSAPLFTDEMGHRITEARIQAAVERVAAAAGEPLETQGAPRFGTHSLRVTGALWAFQSGVSEETVRALGRWRSTSAMLVYLRDTPLVRAAEASAAMAASIEAGHTRNLMSTNFRPGDQDGGRKARAGHGRGQSPLGPVADRQAWTDWDPPPTDADAGTAEHLDNPVWLEMVGNRHGRSVRCRRKRTMPQVLQSSVTDLQAAARMPKRDERRLGD